MAVTTIPKVHFSIVAGGILQVSEPEDVTVMERTVSGKVEDYILKAAESIAKDYVYHLGQNFQKFESARLTFSVEHGVTFEQYNNPFLKESYERDSRPMLPIKKNLVDRQVCRVKPTEQLIDQVRSQGLDPNEIEFVDGAAMLLFGRGCIQPQTIELEIDPFFTVTEGS